MHIYNQVRSDFQLFVSIEKPNGERRKNPYLQNKGLKSRRLQFTESIHIGFRYAGSNE